MCPSSKHLKFEVTLKHYVVRKATFHAMAVDTLTQTTLTRSIKMLHYHHLTITRIKVY